MKISIRKLIHPNINKINKIFRQFLRLLKIFDNFLFISNKFRRYFLKGFSALLIYIFFVFIFVSKDIAGNNFHIVLFCILCFYWVAITIGYIYGMIRERNKKKNVKQQPVFFYEKQFFLRDIFKIKKIKKPYLLTLGAIIIVILLINSGYLASYVNIFPLWKSGPKEVTLKCNYAGQNIEISLTLFSNINRYYNNANLSEKNSALFSGDYSKLTYVHPRDKSIKELAIKIEEIAKLKNFTPDQKIELATCFVQNIPYDSEKAKRVLEENNTVYTEQYPYVTLFMNQGICTDKTYLSAAIIKELGYGTSIMVFSNEKHMALGISVPQGYGSFDSPYAIVEVTNPGFVPGEIPLAIQSGLPKSHLEIINPLTKEDNPQNINFENKTIGPPTKIIPINQGNYYTKIVYVKNLEKKILTSINSLINKKAAIVKAYNNFKYLEKAQIDAYNEYLSTPSTVWKCYPSFYYSYYRQNCYEESNISKSLRYYNYLDYYNRYVAAVNYYNKLVDDYNNTINKINSDINLYKTYQYN